MAEAGISLPKDRVIDGHNLFEILADTTENGLANTRPLYLFHDYAFEAVRIGDWKFIETNYSYTWPVALEHPNYATKAFVPEYSPANSDTSINRLDKLAKTLQPKR